MKYRIFALLTLSFSLLICLKGTAQKQFYVSTLTGGTAGMRNGALDTALFNGPSGIATDTSGNVFVADYNNNVIRKITISTGMVSTLAGDTTGLSKGIDSIVPGLVNGNGTSAKFNYPVGLCTDKAGNVYVADTYNHVIRKIDVAGNVTIYAGDTSGYYINASNAQGFVDGYDSVAKFSYPIGIAIDTSGNLFVADYGNNAVREIWASTKMVTTIAGRGPIYLGYINGAIDTAEFEYIFGIALDDSGAIYVSQIESGSNAIRRIYKGVVTTYAGFDTIPSDSIANITYVPNGYINGKSDTALFSDPAGIVFDSGSLFIADEYNNVIRKVAKDSTVSTFAGNDTIGNINNYNDSAEFYNPIGIAVDKKNAIFYVTDNGNNSIRKITQMYVTGIPKLAVNSGQLMVYPNPSNGKFTIVGTGRDLSVQSSVSVYNVMGEKVFSAFLPQTPKGALNELDLRGQPNGVYLYRVMDEKGNLIGEGKEVIQK